MMKIFLSTVCIAVVLVATTEGLRIRQPSCTKPTPAGCDKEKVCQKKGCFPGQTCELLCGTCRPVCNGQCTPCILAKCSLGYECIADTKKCTANCCKRECNKDLVCATRFCPFGTVATPDECSCTCDCKKSCVKGCPKILRPVCGTDGKTYSNQCILDITTCESNGKIKKRSDGNCFCLRTCLQVHRPVCGTNGKTYSNSCVLRIATCQSNGRIRKKHNGNCGCSRACPHIDRPVCGTDRKTYANSCVLSIATCKSNGRIRMKHNGKCRNCPSFCIALFKPVCGSDGKTYSNSCFLGIASCQSGGKIRQVGNGPCFPMKG